MNNCQTPITLAGLCDAKVKTKPINTAEAMSNWNIVSALKESLCCLLNLEILQKPKRVVFPNVVNVSTFPMGFTLPTNPDLIEVEWNGQDIYNISHPDSGEVKWTIDGNNISLTMAVGMPDVPCLIVVRVFETKKISEVLDCPALESNPCKPCLCGC